MDLPLHMIGWTVTRCYDEKSPPADGPACKMCRGLTQPVFLRGRGWVWPAWCCTCADCRLEHRTPEDLGLPTEASTAPAPAAGPVEDLDAELDRAVAVGVRVLS